MAKYQILKEMGLKTGDRVDIPRFQRLQENVYKKNLKLLSSRIYEKGFFSDACLLSEISNEIGIIIANEKVPSLKKMKAMTKALTRIIDNSFYKPHVTQAKMLLIQLKQIDDLKD